MLEIYFGCRRGNRLTDWRGNQRGFLVLMLLALLILICAPAAAEAYSVQLQAGGETIDLEINPIPPGRIHIDQSNPCHINPDTVVYYCQLILWDPSWATEYTFSAKLTPEGSVYFARFSLSYYYNAAYKYGYLLDSYQCPAHSECTLNPAVQLFIPDDAEQFLFWYDSGTGTQIYVAINIAYSDGRNASFRGGPESHDDIFFCDRYTQPGKPKRVKFRRGRPAGPGD